MITIQVRNREDFDIVEIIVPRSEFMMHESIKEMCRTLVNFIDTDQLVTADGQPILHMAESDNITMRCIVKRIDELDMIV